jgi:hypothetical protein
MTFATKMTCNYVRQIAWTLVANVIVMMMSSHKQWMEYVFELIVFFIC